MATNNDAFQFSFTESPKAKSTEEFNNIRRSPRIAEMQQARIVNNNCPENGKENFVRGRRFLAKMSVEDFGQVIKDVKDTANRTFSNVRSSVCSLPQKLRKSTRRKAFTVLENENTPIKSVGSPATQLYSPFSIETPKNATKNKSSDKSLNRRRFDFSSPSGKLKKDVKFLNSGINELQELERGLQERNNRSRI